MNITLKNFEIINAFNSASELMQCKDIPFKVSWNIMKNIKQIENAFKTYVEMEKKLIQEYAIKDDSGNIEVDDKNQPKFPSHSDYYIKRSELLECVNTLDLSSIKPVDLENCNISPATLYSLEFIINDDE